MHQISVFTVLADVGYANDRKVCIHKKRVCDAALACRRVGLKRVKVLYFSKIRCYDHLTSYRQEALLQRSTFVLNAYLYYVVFFKNNFGVRAYDESEYIDPCDLYRDVICGYQQVQSFLDTDGPEQRHIIR